MYQGEDSYCGGFPVLNEDGQEDKGPNIFGLIVFGLCNWIFVEKATDLKNGLVKFGERWNEQEEELPPHLYALMIPLGTLLGLMGGALMVWLLLYVTGIV